MGIVLLYCVLISFVCRRQLMVLRYMRKEKSEKQDSQMRTINCKYVILRSL